MSEHAIAPPWPQDRYEVSYAFPGRPAVRERYHFASVAIDFARHLALAGLAQKIRVTRLADAAVLYDSAELIELPERQW